MAPREAKRADLVAVGVDDLRRVPGGDGGEELLDVEAALDEFTSTSPSASSASSIRVVPSSSGVPNPVTVMAPERSGIRIIFGVRVVSTSRSHSAAGDQCDAGDTRERAGEDTTRIVAWRFLPRSERWADDKKRRATRGGG